VATGVRIPAMEQVYEQPYDQN